AAGRGVRPDGSRQHGAGHRRAVRRRGAGHHRPVPLRLRRRSQRARRLEPGRAVRARRALGRGRAARGAARALPVRCRSRRDGRGDDERRRAVAERTVVSTELTLAELASAEERDLGSSPWVKIEQERVNRFADATDDHQWIHVDLEAAKSGPFGGTIAHGYLSLSLLPALLANLLRVPDAQMGVNYGIDRVRFTSPVPVGSEVRVNARLLSSEPKGDGILYKVGVQIEIKGQEKPAMVGEVLYLALGQPAATEKEEHVSEGAAAGPSLDEIFQGVQSRFEADKASGVAATVQWLIKDGDAEQPYALTIKGGQF